jgi:hypothetical protein
MIIKSDRPSFIVQATEEANTLAFLSGVSATKKKSFITFTLVNVIKRFTAVSYDFS